jgi:hypothetical protein
MTNKHDQPFAELRLWIPLDWQATLQRLKANPQLAQTVCDLAQRILCAIQEDTKND